jgi:hypothetical protein
MAESIESIVARIERLTTAGHRSNLVARGLARGLVWRDGVLPLGSPDFSPDLSTDLLDHGFQLLSSSLSLRAANGDRDMVNRGLHAAAESLESSARNESRNDVHRGFHLTMAAAAFHIGGYAARAYSLFEGDLAGLNLSSYEKALVLLMRRNLAGLRTTFTDWLTDEANSDEAVLARLEGTNREEGDEELGADEVVAMALTRHFHRGIAIFEHAIVSGIERHFLRSITFFVRGEQASSEAKHVPLWWAFRVARHLCDDLWGNSLRVVLPKDGGPPLWTEMREKFIRMLIAREVSEIDLWPSQIPAAKRVVDTSDDLVVALPTSAGKTRIAELCIVRTLADSRRVIYVTPLRALSAQIENGLARTFRPLGVSVTSVYGASGVANNDLETLKSARIVVATPEKLDFAVRQEPSVIDDVGLIILDEGHMIGLGQREIRYEMLVQRLLRRTDASERRIVCLSAVFTEGEAFNDFTAWLRSDEPGDSIRSLWRPTRQRPGVLRWMGSVGRLVLEVDGEKPFVPRFVESQAARSRRQTSFPNNPQEFLVASVTSFLSRKQTVLIYCPQKRSVEPTAQAFLNAHKQGYFTHRLSAELQSAIVDAKRIGEEWLGKEHPGVKCLDLGIAVHHGSLPRQFLGEIEHLLRRRILPICVCSPTLAQGLDLSFGVLFFQSIYRAKDTVPPNEFANVVGRVGRAFVDLDGLYVFPVYETDKSKADNKIRVFAKLRIDAQKRQLESGVRELIARIIFVLQSRLGCDANELAEYVLNANSPWTLEPKEDGFHNWLDLALNELDTAILGIIDVLDLPTEKVADYLDQCLQSSYWQRRLRNATPEQRVLQAKIINGRAMWLWRKTKESNRRAYFASGVGHKAGIAIEEELDTLYECLNGAEEQLEYGEILTAANHTATAAEILYKIGPFVPDSTVGDLHKLLNHWLSGSPLSTYPNKDAIGFIQDNIVYRLVWAIEATRLHLEHLRGESDKLPGADLALCLTYGVPSVKAALLMQGGIRSRSFATEAAEMIDEKIGDFKELKAWVRLLRKGEVQSPIWDTEEQKSEWRRFLSRFEHRDKRPRVPVSIKLRATWSGSFQPKTKQSVRVIRIGESFDAVITSISSLPIGKAILPRNLMGNYFTGRVLNNKRTIRISKPN